jgi:hypothetical protein
MVYDVNNRSPLRKVILFLMLPFGLLLLVCGGCSVISMALPDIPYSDGERTGVITKFSHKGIFWKTWEGEMYLGGVKQTTNSDGQSAMVANIWEFSITDPELIEQVKQAQRDGERHTLHYKQVGNPKPWNGSTGYFVTKVVQTPK